VLESVRGTDQIEAVKEGLHTSNANTLIQVIQSFSLRADNARALSPLMYVSRFKALSAGAMDKERGYSDAPSPVSIVEYHQWVLSALLR